MMMKQGLLKGALAFILGGIIAGCTHDEEFETNIVDAKKKAYEEVFKEEFGTIDPNHTWGFGNVTTPAASRFTRSISVNDDVYKEFNWPTDEELAAAFPTAVPEGATDVPENGDYNFYFGNGEGYNYKIETAGEYSIGGSWMNTERVNVEGHPQGGYTKTLLYNVYVNTTGNVTLSRNGDAHFNLYVLKGNVTLASNFGEMSGKICVAPGATLYDARDHIASNYGIKVFNRGSYIATNTTVTGNYAGFDIGNYTNFYNQGYFEAKGPLSYSPADANTSYFYNRGTGVALKAPSMTLNSSCHFFTEGTVEIEGETRVTQKDIVWVNNGHYTTGSMTFSAKNGTFFNYCQLIVVNDCNFTDGLFNMMTDSYAEIGRGLFNNFRVNMHNNSGFNVLRGSKWGREGADFIYAHQMQGFMAVNDDAVVYVRLAGDNSIPAHKGSSFHVQGANLTLAYENMTFYDNFTEVGVNTTWDAATYSDPVTAQDLIDRQDENTTWDLHNVTKIIDGDDFANTGFTVEEGNCAGTWYGEGPEPETITIPTDHPVEGNREFLEITLVEQGRVFCEDLGNISSNDFDFNDVVFDAYVFKKEYSNEAGEVTRTEYATYVVLLAAGGTLTLSVAGDEVHNKLGTNFTTTIINTAADESESYGNKHAIEDPVLIGPFTYQHIADIPVNVQYTAGVLKLQSEEGAAPHKFCVRGTAYPAWCKERHKLKDAYPGFSDWVHAESDEFWVEGKTINTEHLFANCKPGDAKYPHLPIAVQERTWYSGSGATGGYRGEDVLSRQAYNLFNK